MFARIVVLLLLVLGLGACDRGEAASSRPPADGAPATSVAGPGAPAPASLSVGIAIPSHAHAVAWVADESGHWKRAGVASKVVVTGGSAAAMRTLIAGGVDVALAGGDAALKARAAGADVVVLGSLVNRFYHRLVTVEGVTSAAALRGKTIGLPFLGGPQDMAVRHGLKQLGLKYGEDVKVLSLGKEMNRMAALQKKEIDGTTSQTPPAQLKRLGLHVLVDLPSMATPFPYMVIATRRAVLKGRRAAMLSFVKGLCRAINDYRDPKRRDANLVLVGKHLSNADTTGAALERFQSGGPSTLALPPVPDRAGFDTVVALAEKPALARHVTTLLDGSVVEAAIQSGDCAASAP